jgi:hypothetical protein
MPAVKRTAIFRGSARLARHARAASDDHLGEQAEPDEDDEHVPRDIREDLLWMPEPEDGGREAGQRCAGEHDEEPKAGQKRLRQERHDEDRGQDGLRVFAHRTKWVNDRASTSTSQRG